MGACTSKVEVLSTPTEKSAKRYSSGVSFDLGDYEGGALLSSARPSRSSSSHRRGRAQSHPSPKVASHCSGTDSRPHQAGQESTEGKLRRPALSIAVPTGVHSFSRDDFLKMMQDHDQDDFSDTTPSKSPQTSSPHCPPLESTSPMSLPPPSMVMDRRFSEPAVRSTNNSDIFAYRIHQIRQGIEYQNKHTLSPLGGQKGSRVTFKFKTTPDRSLQPRRGSVPSVFPFVSYSH